MAFQIGSFEAAKKYAAPTALILFCEILTGSYLLATLKISATSHFWVDEVLAVWVARLPTAHDITTAIWNGAEFSPPTYDLFLHALFETFGSGRVVARLPSILAVLSVAIAFACLVWRRLGMLSAALTFGLVLNSPLFDFATQARPYALLTALGTAAVLLWSRFSPDGRNRWRAAGLAVLLFASVSLHFYAIVDFAVFALMEGLWSLAHRRVRPPIWLAISGAAAASMVWLPLMRHLAAFNGGDTGAPAFYGAPSLTHLADHVDALFIGSHVAKLFFLAVVVLIGAAVAVSAAIPVPMRRPMPQAAGADIAIIAFGLLAALPAGFGLALVATHVFSARYALLATIGAILFLVLGLRKAPFAREIGIVLCAVLCILPLLRAGPQDLSADAIAMLGHAGADGPIVVSDGNLFLELMESADPALLTRLVHLTRPPGVVDGDTSAEHQVNRLLTSFRPDLPVKDPLTFMAAYSTFADVCRPTRATDALCGWFIAKGWVVGLVGLGSNVALFKVQAESSHAQHP